MRKFLIFTIVLLGLANFTSLADTFVVSVGIANYANPKVSNLSSTEKDAIAMADFFKKGTDNVVTITGKYATKRQILKALKHQFSKAKSVDKIIFFFSGHGYPGGFCPYDMLKVEDGLTYREILEVMKSSRAKSKFIFADACFSGSMRKNGNRQNRESLTENTRNILFFLSSRDGEVSIESPFTRNGYFTKFLLKGLRGAADNNRDRKITASELYRFVSEGVKNQSQDRQHPVMWGKFRDDMTIVEYTK